MQIFYKLKDYFTIFSFLSDLQWLAQIILGSLQFIIIIKWTIKVTAVAVKKKHTFPFGVFLYKTAHGVSLFQSDEITRRGRKKKGVEMKEVEEEQRDETLEQVSLSF